MAKNMADINDTCTINDYLQCTRYKPAKSKACVRRDLPNTLIRQYIGQNSKKRRSESPHGPTKNEQKRSLRISDIWHTEYLIFEQSDNVIEVDLPHTVAG